MHAVLIAKVTKPEHQVIKRDIFELDPYAITRGWLAALQGTIQTTRTQGLVNYDDRRCCALPAPCDKLLVGASCTPRSGLSSASDRSQLETLADMVCCPVSSGNQTNA